MPLSSSTGHTPLKLCAIVSKWLEENDYNRLFVRHGTARCGVSVYDRGGNPIDIGFINGTEVTILSGDEDFSATTITAYDKKFFDLLAETLKFAKP